MTDRPSDEAADPPSDAEGVRQAEQLARDRSAIAHGRRLGGAPGAMMAGAMLALRDVLEPPRDDRPVAEVEAPGDPHDLDRDGLALAADDIGGDADVYSAPLPAKAPIEARRRRRPRR